MLSSRHLGDPEPFLRGFHIGIVIDLILVGLDNFGDRLINLADRFRRGPQPDRNGGEQRAQ
jgi:hypothetical protein